MFSLSSRRFGGAELELPVRLVAAEEIDATEQIIRKLLDARKSLAEARQELGYHSRQTRRK
jgi:hypothetical protein